jgi:hypothetical protein
LHPLESAALSRRTPEADLSGLNLLLCKLISQPRFARRRALLSAHTPNGRCAAGCAVPHNTPLSIGNDDCTRLYVDGLNAAQGVCSYPDFINTIGHRGQFNS